MCGLSLMTAVGAAATNDSRLIDAVKSKDATAVRALLKQRADVNAAQGDGATALHWAVHYDDLAIADLLLKAGARANAADDIGVTPLYLACTNRDAAMVDKLLTAGADPNAALLNGETVLMNCARTGNAASVKALLLKGARVNVKESAHDQTALMWAAAEKHPEVVRVLLETGADIRARSRTYTQTVSSESTQRAGREELNYTVLRGGSTPLLFAARAGDAESTTLLLAAGADPNDTLANAMSALIEAAHSGGEEAALVLLEKGADPNAAGIGYTALHAAVLRSESKLVKALLAHGANPEALITKGTPIRRNNTDWNLPATLIGATPYLVAAKFLEADIMRALVAGRADPQRTLKDGTTAVMLAAGMGSGGNSDRRGLPVLDGGKIEPESQVLAGVTAALALGGDVNATNQAGDTALHSAASQGYDMVVQLLADKGANLTAKNKRGQTPLAQVTRPGGRGARPDASGAVDIPESGPIGHQSTADLLRKLGATE
jgi:ankyrin repeat protein